MHKHHTGWVFLVCIALLAGACSDDTPVSEPETDAKTAAQQPELPVREWYPTPKHARPRITISPAPAQVPMTQQPSSKAMPVPQQQWNMQPQPYVTPQPPAQWNGSVQHYSQPPVQQPVTPQQYQYVNPYQHDPRPWGSVPNSSQQGTARDYWGTPVSPGGQYYVYPAPGMPGYAR